MFEKIKDKLFKKKDYQFSKIEVLLASDSPIFCDQNGKEIIKPNIYQKMQKSLKQSEIRDNFIHALKVKAGLLKNSLESWCLSNALAIEFSVKSDMQTSKGILGHFIWEWCQILTEILQSYLEKYKQQIKVLLAESNQYQYIKKELENFDKMIIEILHKNILVLVQLLWEVIRIVYDSFFQINEDEFIRDQLTKNPDSVITQIRKNNRRNLIRKQYERMMLANLTTLDPFKKLYRCLLKYSVNKIIEPKKKEEKQNFQQFLKKNFNITENYSKVFATTFQEIEEYHRSPNLQEKFIYICSFYDSISKSIRISMESLPQQKRVAPENSVLELFTYIFRIIFPQTSISVMYIDLFFALRKEQVSWESNYEDMEKELQMYFKLYFHEDLTNHYERLRNSYDSTLKK